MTAETAQSDAEMAAGTHVLMLFLAANGDHVMDVETTDANETAAHVRECRCGHGRDRGCG